MSLRINSSERHFGVLFVSKGHIIKCRFSGTIPRYKEPLYVSVLSYFYVPPTILEIRESRNRTFYTLLFFCPLTEAYGSVTYFIVPTITEQLIVNVLNEVAPWYDFEK